MVRVAFLDDSIVEGARKLPPPAAMKSCRNATPWSCRESATLAMVRARPRAAAATRSGPRLDCRAGCLYCPSVVCLYCPIGCCALVLGRLLPSCHRCTFVLGCSRRASRLSRYTCASSLLLHVSFRVSAQESLEQSRILKKAKPIEQQFALLRALP